MISEWNDKLHEEGSSLRRATHSQQWDILFSYKTPFGSPPVHPHGGEIQISRATLWICRLARRHLGFPAAPLWATCLLFSCEKRCSRYSPLTLKCHLRVLKAPSHRTKRTMKCRQEKVLPAFISHNALFLTRKRFSVSTKTQEDGEDHFGSSFKLEGKPLSRYFLTKYSPRDGFSASRHGSRRFIRPP